MGFFSRDKRPKELLPSRLTALLTEYGRQLLSARLSSGSIVGYGDDPRFQELYLAVMNALSAGHSDAVVHELFTAATSVRPEDQETAKFGAYSILNSWSLDLLDGSVDESRAEFYDLWDSALEYMTSRGATAYHLSEMEMRRINPS